MSPSEINPAVDAAYDFMEAAAAVFRETNRAINSTPSPRRHRRAAANLQSASARLLAALKPLVE